jgi:hypothetical protein
MASCRLSSVSKPGCTSFRDRDKRASEKRAATHLASALKGSEFYKEFETRGIPLECNNAEKSEKELRDLGTFFGLAVDPSADFENTTAADDRPQSRHILTARGIRSSLGTVAEASVKELQDTRPLTARDEKSYRFSTCKLRPGELVLSARQRLHRPVTAGELEEARPPKPFAQGELLPTILRDPNRPRRPESHYEYFNRQLPTEHPEFRQAMWSKTEAMRRNLNYPANKSQLVFSMFR